MWDDATGVVRVVGVAGALALLGIVWAVLRPFARGRTRALVVEREPSFDDAVVAAVKHRGPEIKRWLEGPDMFAKEFAARDEAVRLAHDTAAQLEVMRSAIEPMGEMPTQIGRLADSLTRMERTLDKVVEEAKGHGQSLAELRGEFKAYTGPERRRHDRRGSGSTD